MFDRPERCPDADDEILHPNGGPFRKRGKHRTSDGRVLQRYQCKDCGKTFTNASSDPGRLQRRNINRELFGLICSGATIRRSARLLGVAVNTVRHRMDWLAERAREAHLAALRDGSLATAHVMFDEMETFLHSRSQPLSIALVVRAKTGQILSAQVGRIPAKGRLAAKGRARGWTVNHGPATRAAALVEASPSIVSEATVSCDGYPSYPAEITRALQGLRVIVDAKPARMADQGRDPLFRLNHVCAKIRADVACMARDTWTTTKSIRHLQGRLDIYIAWNNGYNQHILF